MGISKIWIYGESTDGVVATSTLELLAKARTIAETVEVVVHGNVSAVATELGEHGASTVMSIGELGNVLHSPRVSSAMA